MLMNGSDMTDSAIDPAKTRAIVQCWPDRTITWEAAAWLYGVFPPQNIVAMCIRGIIQARNLAVREVVLKAPDEITDFVFMDHDMRPSMATMPFLRADADVVGCEFPIPHMEAWADPQAIHMGLVRVRRKVFEKIDPPWFRFEYSPDGSQLEKCECIYFRDKALAAGFSVVRAGWCDHDFRGRGYQGV